MALENLQSQFKGLTDRIDAMSLRERALIFITLLVALYFIAVHVIFGPISLEKDRLQKQINQKREETRLMEVQVQGVLSAGAQGAHLAKQKKLAALQENLKNMDASLQQVTTGLVPPKEMARLVEQMLLKNRGLQVIKLESLPAVPLLENAGKSGGKTADGTVYKHGMRIEFKGGYMDTLRYLRSLEAMPWKVFWGQVALSAEKYPDSRVNLLIYTLSTDQGWIGI
jgi:MSHA biogenesis protein MshJ